MKIKEEPATKGSRGAVAGVTSYTEQAAEPVRYVSNAENPKILKYNNIE